MRAAIALGSNLGDRRANLASALAALASLPRTQLLAASAFIETDPVGPLTQGAFLNAAAMIETGLGARELLNHLLAIELAHGRIRGESRWGPRTLDLDLLLYGQETIDEPGLTIPHPRLHERLFVLEPLASIAPEVLIPTLGKTVREQHDVVAAGPAPAGARWAAGKVNPAP